MSKSNLKNKEVKAAETVADTDVQANYDEQVAQRIDPKTEAKQQESEPNVENENITDEVQRGELLEILSSYKESYPDNKIFHVATDGQVFLEKSLSDARNFQKTLSGNSNDLRSVEVN